MSLLHLNSKGHEGINIEEIRLHMMDYSLQLLNYEIHSIFRFYNQTQSRAMPVFWRGRECEV